MDIWRATTEQIKVVAERKTGKKTLSVRKLSGLYARVILTDGTVITVYDDEVTNETR